MTYENVIFDVTLLKKFRFCNYCFPFESKLERLIVLKRLPQRLTKDLKISQHTDNLYDSLSKRKIKISKKKEKNLFGGESLNRQIKATKKTTLND